MNVVAGLPFVLLSTYLVDLTSFSELTADLQVKIGNNFQCPEVIDFKSIVLK